MRFPFRSIAAAFILLALATPAFAQSFGNPIAPVESAAAEGGHVLKAGPGSLYGLTVAIGTTAGYAMVLNSTTVPSDGAVTPVLCYNIPASSNAPYSYPWPVAFSTGITVVFSTTGCFTKTASNAYFSAQVK